MFLSQACLAKRCNCTRSTSCSLRSRRRRCLDCSEFFWPCLPPRWSTLFATNFICDHANPITPRSIAKPRFWSKARTNANTMKLRTTLALALSIFALTARAEKIALVNGTIIHPDKSQIVQNATIIIDGDKIAAAGDAKTISTPKDARLIDCKGKFILPGYIDTHVHFFQSADLYTRPDVVDLTKVRPYADEVAWIKRNLPDTFERYLRSGITSVVDVGGPFWNFEVRKIANATPKAPRVAVAGPLISSVSREKLDLGDPPIVKIDSPEQAREFVRKLAAQNPDLVKIWYIVDKDHPVDSFRPIVRATVEESHARKLRVAVHATELETARAAVEEGADVLVHSVIDKKVDDAFVKLLQDRHVMLCPTLVVFEDRKST